MILDCFTFFNELDLLEIRFRILDKHVDAFVLIESDYTYSGQEKERIFAANAKRFAQWSHKIVQLNPPAGAFAKLYRSRSSGRPFDARGIEEMSRNSLQPVLTAVGADDFVILSDVDEVPSSAGLARAVQALQAGAKCTKLIQKNHYYFVNMSRGRWGGSIVASVDFFRSNPPNAIRVDKNIPKMDIAEGGWHWSFLGGVEGILSKLSSYSHYNLNHPPYNDLAHVMECLKTGKDIFNRDPWVAYDISEYAPDIRSILNDYPNLIFEPKRIVNSDLAN